MYYEKFQSSPIISIFCCKSIPTCSDDESSAVSDDEVLFVTVVGNEMKPLGRSIANAGSFFIFLFASVSNNYTKRNQNDVIRM